ncbi:MAG: radical SAM protein [Phycisphaerae bacterium]
MDPQDHRPSSADPIRDHRRQWRDCLYVYPVVSRRSRGLSIGVNLNPDKRCNFACVYCQVDRHLPRNLRQVDLDKLRGELHIALDEAVSGTLWKRQRFAGVAPEMKRINDIAFSGDGEPTCLPDFDKAVRVAAESKWLFDCEETKIVVITNATQLRSEQVARALPILDENNGEIWAKLDAGSEEFFQRVSRPHPKVTLDEIVGNITHVAKGRPVVIQTLWMRLDGEPPAEQEVGAYIERLRGILDAGGQIKLVQIHTVARPPWEQYVRTLEEPDLRVIADRVSAALPQVPVDVYPGADVPPMDRPR